MTSSRAKVFWTGRSQAVRLPKEFRFPGEDVLIRREGQAVILEPVDAWPDGYAASFAGVPADVRRGTQGRHEEREEVA